MVKYVIYLKNSTLVTAYRIVQLMYCVYYSAHPNLLNSTKTAVITIVDMQDIKLCTLLVCLL